MQILGSFFSQLSRRSNSYGLSSGTVDPGDSLPVSRSFRSARIKSPFASDQSRPQNRPLRRADNDIVLPNFGTMEKTEKSEKIEKVFLRFVLNGLAQFGSNRPSRQDPPRCGTAGRRCHNERLVTRAVLRIDPTLPGCEGEGAVAATYKPKSSAPADFVRSGRHLVALTQLRATIAASAASCSP